MPFNGYFCYQMTFFLVKQQKRNIEVNMPVGSKIKDRRGGTHDEDASSWSDDEIAQPSQSGKSAVKSKSNPSTTTGGNNVIFVEKWSNVSENMSCIEEITTYPCGFNVFIAEYSIYSNSSTNEKRQ